MQSAFSIAKRTIHVALRRVRYSGEISCVLLRLIDGILPLPNFESISYGTIFPKLQTYFFEIGPILETFYRRLNEMVSLQAFETLTKHDFYQN